MRECVIKYAATNWDLDFSYVLDLACGEGTITEILISMGYATNIEGVDICEECLIKYTAKFERPALKYSFADIVEGRFPQKKYSLIVCSYGLHFCDSKQLPDLLKSLSRLSTTLLVIGYCTTPAIPETDWRLTKTFFMNDGSKGRLYKRKLWMI